MLKLVVLKVFLKQVLESIANENNDWRYMCVEIELDNKELFNCKAEIDKDELVELTLQCPEYIKNQFKVTKEDILGRFKPVTLTEEKVRNINRLFYVYAYYDEGKFEWEICNDCDYILGVNYYTLDDCRQIANLLNENNIEPY